MTVTAPTEVLAHHDALLDVFASITQDCALTGVQPIGLSLANYSAGYFHMSVHLADVDEVDAIAAVWSCRPDDGVGGNYTRHGTLDVDGRTVTVNAYTGRPRLGFPTGYAPVAVNA